MPLDGVEVPLGDVDFEFGDHGQRPRKQRVRHAKLPGNGPQRIVFRAERGQNLRTMSLNRNEHFRRSI